jgi:hypothetical protein
VASTEFNDGMPRILGDDPYNSEPTQWRMFTVTPTQFTILQRWGAGDFLASRLGPPSLLDPPAADTVTPAGLDRAATECASGGPFFPGIEVGWLICEPDLFAEPFRIRHGAPTAYLGDADEERTTVGAGYFSRQMALPWLADFLQCKGEVHPQEGEPGFQEGAPQFRWGWWPSQRPDQVVGRSGQRVAWHRATGPDGEQAIWPDTGTEAEPDRDEFTPSYREMLANWWKFGFIEPQNADGEPITHWNQFAEAERAEQVPALDDTP